MTRTMIDLSTTSIETILPHRGTMLLLDSVSAFNDETLTAHATVRSDAWYADATGAMPAWIGVELMAQAIAAHVALLAMRDGGKARPGVLLGSRSYQAQKTSFPRDARLSIEVKPRVAQKQIVENLDLIGSRSYVHEIAPVGQMVH